MGKNVQSVLCILLESTDNHASLSYRHIQCRRSKGQVPHVPGSSKSAALHLVIYGQKKSIDIKARSLSSAVNTRSPKPKCAHSLAR